MLQACDPTARLNANDRNALRARFVRRRPHRSLPFHSIPWQGPSTSLSTLPFHPNVRPSTSLSTPRLALSLSLWLRPEGGAANTHSNKRRPTGLRIFTFPSGIQQPSTRSCAVFSLRSEARVRNPAGKGLLPHCSTTYAVPSQGPSTSLSTLAFHPKVRPPRFYPSTSLSTSPSTPRRRRHKNT